MNTHAPEPDDQYEDPGILDDHPTPLTPARCQNHRTRSTGTCCQRRIWKPNCWS